MKAGKVILAALVIFFAGVVSGVLATRIIFEQRVGVLAVKRTIPEEVPPPLRRFDFMRRLERELALTSEQHTNISKILGESRERSRQLWQTIDPQLREEMRSVRQQIKAQLNPEQQQKFESVMRPRHPSDKDRTRHEGRDDRDSRPPGRAPER